jgi:hypothetical protein
VDDQGSPVQDGWKARLRRWLWLDRGAVRSDKSQANRGFYSGGPPVGRRFVVPLVVLGIAIALAILLARDAEAATDDESRIGPVACGDADHLGIRS